jgi:hypothetical protein
LFKPTKDVNAAAKGGETSSVVIDVVEAVDANTLELAEAELTYPDALPCVKYCPPYEYPVEESTPATRSLSVISAAPGVVPVNVIRYISYAEVKHPFTLIVDDELKDT